MSTNRIRVTSAEYELPTFAFYEFFADPTNLSVDDVEANADVKAASFSTEWLHTGLTPGATWYYWVRAVRYNGLVLARSSFLAIGAIVAGSISSTDIADGAVTYAKIQNVAGDKILGRNSGTSGVVQEVPCTSAGRALLAGANAAAQRTTLGAGAASGLATLDGSAYLTAGQFPALTGDVTTSAGAVATTIAANAVTLAKMQQITTARLLGRSTSGTGNVEQISVGSGLTLTGGVLDAVGGGGGVSSVFGRTGTVVAASSDYSFSQISGICGSSQGGAGSVSGILKANGSGTVSAAGTSDYNKPGPAFRARANGNQTLTGSGIPTKITLGVENYDVTGDFNSSTTFTVPTGYAGKYHLNASFVADDTVNATSQIGYIYKNGSALLTGYSGASGGGTGVQFNDILDLAVGDTIELWGQCTGTAPYARFINTTWTSFLAMCYLRA